MQEKKKIKKKIFFDIFLVLIKIFLFIIGILMKLINLKMIKNKETIRKKVIIIKRRKNIAEVEAEVQAKIEKKATLIVRAIVLRILK